MKYLFLLMGWLTAGTLFGQGSAFIQVRKGDMPVKTFFVGSFATFGDAQGAWYNGKIINIQNDSVFFREIVVQQRPTAWGIYMLDTTTSFIRKIHYREIAAIPRRKQNFTYVRNGTLPMIAGAGFIGLNLVNSAYQHYAPFGRDNRPLLLTAAGVFALGKMMQWAYRPNITIGKKYTIRYIQP